MENTITSLRNKANKPDTWAKDFSKLVDQNEANVLAKLEQAKENTYEHMISDDRDDARLTMNRAADKLKYERLMLKLLTTALGPLNDEDELTNIDEPDEVTTGDGAEAGKISVSHVAVDTQQYFNVITGLVRDSHKLINSYIDHKDQQVAPSRLGNLSATFQKDREAATTAVAAGQKIVMSSVEEMLADPHHQVRGRPDMTAEDEHSARSMLARAKGEDSEPGVDHTWGEVAQDMVKAARYLEGSRG